MIVRTLCHFVSGRGTIVDPGSRAGGEEDGSPQRETPVSCGTRDKGRSDDTFRRLVRHVFLHINTAPP